MSQSSRKSCHMATSNLLEHKAWLMLSSAGNANFVEYEFMYTDTLTQLYDEDDQGNFILAIPAKQHKRITTDIIEALTPS